MAEESRLVYSSDKAIPRKEKSAAKEPQPTPHTSGQIYIRLERKGRRGKSVTLVEGLQMRAGNREDLLSQLKTRLGTGGTDKDGTLEIQGDHRDAIMGLLQDMGYKPKRSGG